MLDMVMWQKPYKVTQQGIASLNGIEGKMDYEFKMKQNNPSLMCEIIFRFVLLLAFRS
jgi:hypothetical protein